MKIFCLIICITGISSIFYSTESEALNEGPGAQIYQCYHRADGVRDPMPYAFVGPNGNCPTPPDTSNGHRKTTEFDHHCDTVKVENWI